MPLLVKRKSALECGNGHGHEQTRPELQLSLKHFDSNTLMPDWASTIRPVSESGPAHSRLSHELHADNIHYSVDPSTDDERAKSTSRPRKRFSLMKLRNYSESHLTARAKMTEQRLEEREGLPPVPTITADDGVVPKIVRTAPTMDHTLDAPQHAEEEEPEDERRVRPSIFKRASSKRLAHQSPRVSMEERRPERKSGLRWRRSKATGLDDLHRLSTMNVNNNHALSAPPSYNDVADSALAVPVSNPADPRSSESSRSDGSNDSAGHIYGSTTTTTHTVSTHTTFFKLPRRNKNRNSLFPLPIKIPPPRRASHEEDEPTTPRASSRSNTPEIHGTPSEHPLGPPLRRRHTESSPNTTRGNSHLAHSPNAALAKSSLSFAEPGQALFRQDSQRSLKSTTSSPLQPPMRLGMRDRSSTTSSFGRSSRDVDTPPPLSGSGRNSTSTTGRSSLGGFLSLSRFRQGSEPHSPRHGSPGTRSKSNSFAISREALVIPEREEGDTPGKYLERLESAISRSVIAGILSRSADPFSAAVLRSYTRRFAFFGEPVDMSLRKFLLEAELPKETQQVDRVVQAFADRYHECNPGIFTDSGIAYMVAFSIMMLHTDAFNRNVKRKMTKQDYIKNIRGQDIDDAILSCFYDNICYTPFVHYDEDVDINGQRVMSFKPKNKGGKLKSAIPGAEAVGKKPSGPVDPYNLLVEGQLDALRTSQKGIILMDDPYDYRGNHGSLDVQYLQRAFTHTGVLQIISARSRPAAYESQVVNGAPNPTESQQGIVDLKITKVGTLWRKSSKKKKTRSPWQEWGAILTGSQLYLFKNSHWAKGLMHQFQQHQRPGQSRMPVTFKPPLQDFKPDALIKTDNAVALVDSTYNRHKNAFVFWRTGGEEEVLLADNENELNDWLGLINYAAAFRAAGVRIRGMIGNEEDMRNRELARLDSTTSNDPNRTRNGDVTLTSRGLTPQLQKQVMAARRQIMVHKIAEMEKEVTDMNRTLETMLRNARHIDVLAPVAERTKQDVLGAAKFMQDRLKWQRREIWRLKCHRDILAMDVRLDGLTAADLEKLAQEHAQQQAELESARKEKPKILSRLSSHRVRSPPQSPTTRQITGRPSTAGSTDTAIGKDVFRTPPESTSPQRDDGWRLPSLSLDASTSNEHRPSVSSTLLSTPASMTRGGSLTHSSSASSVLQAHRTHSTGPLEPSKSYVSGSVAPSLDDKELQLLARSTTGPAEDESSRIPNVDGAQVGQSPESKHKGARRSLHKTLRDAHYRDHSHRHKRNKESVSTVRSGGHAEQDVDDATPGLQRDKPKFILHGKQASVVQFGGDWDKMRLRREQYERQHASTPPENQSAYERRRLEQQDMLRSGMKSPAIQDFRRHGSITEDDDAGSVLSEGTRSFREDAEAAIAYSSTGASASPRRLSSSTDDAGMTTDSEIFDLTEWDPDAGRRQTVIGPSRPFLPGSTETQRHRRYSSLEKDEHGNITVVDTSDDEAPVSPSIERARQNRRTVIGPSSSSSGIFGVTGTGKNRESTSAEASRSVLASAQEEDTDMIESVEGEAGFIRPVSDEEIRQMSLLGSETVRTR